MVDNFLKGKIMNIKPRLLISLVLSFLVLLFVCTALLLVAGRKSEAEQPKYSLYDKSGSVRDAVIHTGVPEDRIDRHVKSLSYKSPARLPNKSELLFIRKILNVTSIEDWEQLLCPESLKQLSQSKGAMITRTNRISGIEKAKWPISAPAGAKILAVIRDYTDINTKSVEFALRPSHSVTLLYYHKEKKMFLGERLYLIERDGEISLISDAYSEWGAHLTQMAEDLQSLYTALESYAKDNDGRLPDSLNALNGKLEIDILRRLITGVTYIGAGKILNTQSKDVIAYDKRTSEDGKKFVLKSNGKLSYRKFDK